MFEATITKRINGETIESFGLFESEKEAYAKIREYFKNKLEKDKILYVREIVFEEGLQVYDFGSHVYFGQIRIV